jgi:hypothetical protein
VVHLQRGDALEVTAGVFPDRRCGVEAGGGQQLSVGGPGAGPHGAVVRVLEHILSQPNGQKSSSSQPISELRATQCRNKAIVGLPCSARRRRGRASRSGRSCRRRRRRAWDRRPGPRRGSRRAPTRGQRGPSGGGPRAAPPV